MSPRWLGRITTSCMFALLPGCGGGVTPASTLASPGAIASSAPATTRAVNSPTDLSSRHTFLGIIPDPSSADSTVGVLISGAAPGTPADRAGLQPGDLLVQFASRPLENLSDLTRAMAASKPGDTVKLKVLRGSQTFYFDVTLAERKGQSP